MSDGPRRGDDRTEESQVNSTDPARNPRLAALCALTFTEAVSIAVERGVDLSIVWDLWRCPDCALHLADLEHEIGCEPELTSARLHLIASTITKAA